MLNSKYRASKTKNEIGNLQSKTRFSGTQIIKMKTRFIFVI